MVETSGVLNPEANFLYICVAVKPRKWVMFPDYSGRTNIGSKFPFQEEKNGEKIQESLVWNKFATQIPLNFQTWE